MTDAPPLRQRLHLESPVRSPDLGGGATVSWSEVGVHYAAILPATGAESRIGSAQAQRVTHRVLVRAAPVGGALRPRAQQRFRAGARIFDIKAVFEADGGGRRLTCLCEESVLG